jgi:pimeloyl-ACP methyl ester carboxylesterase
MEGDAVVWQAIGIGLPAAVAAALAGCRALAQAQGAQRLALSGPDAIDEAGFVPIGGIDQWVSIRGEARANPVLVILHGGPGSALQLISQAALRPWEADFTVVHWDQRGAGRTFGRNGPKGSGELSIDRVAADAVEVVQHALARTGQAKAKAILLGASWGTIVGVAAARLRPDLLHAYVGAGQVVDMAANEEVSYDGLMARLRERGARKAEARLAALGPPPYASLQVLVKQRRILSAYPPRSERGLFRRLFGVVLTAPGVRLADIRDWFAGVRFSTRSLYAEMMAYCDRTAAPAIPVPVVIIQGEEDIQTPTSLARAYFETLDAPQKVFVVIPGGGHTALIAMAETFHEALRTHVRPLAG